ncbi:DUF6089 family protein [Niabella terrae]
MKCKVLFTAALISFLSLGLQAQEFVAQKNSVGIAGGATSYTGHFSVDAPLDLQSSLYASLMYRRRIVKQLYVRAEGMVGRLRADNRGVEEQADNHPGAFQTEIGELSAKLEYEFLDLYKHRVTPYVMAGVGGYGLFNYYSTEGKRDNNDKIGFVMPVGGGVKYNVNNRFKIFAEGSVRFFNKNLDGLTTETGNNPNKYYTAGIGLIYELTPFNPLW